MRKFTPFETSVIGFFIGVVVATSLAFVTATSSFVGELLTWVSLLPVAAMLNIPADHMVFEFLFVVAVYTLYGFLIGAVLQFTIVDKTKFVAALAVLVFAGMGAEQYIGMSLQPVGVSELQASVLQSKLQLKQKTPAQYFGTEGQTEARGDLNADGKDDVAFLIPRPDETYGTIYYLSVALATDNGHAGTNLMFLGNEVVPKNISIKDGVIDIEYANTHMYRHVVDGVLEKVSTVDVAE